MISISQILHLYFRIVRGLTLGVRAIVRSHDGKFLLVRHTYAQGWHFPGGGVEKGATILSTLRNELLEETGLHLIGTPVFHGVFLNRDTSERDQVLVYLCETMGEKPSSSINYEISEVGYFEIDNLPADTDPGTVRRMQEVLHGFELSECW